MADDSKADNDDAKASGGGKKKLIIIGGVVAVLLLGGGGAALTLLGGDPDVEAAADTGEAAEDVPREALYVPLDPPFVVNFHDKKNRTKFLKLELNAVTRDPEVKASLTKHMPMIRNSLVLLFSRQVYEDLVPHEGKEELRAKALAEVRSVLSAEAAKGEVEDVLFTSFVMQ